MSNGADAESWSGTIKSVRDTVIPSVEKQLTALLLAQPQLLIDAKTNPEAFILGTRELLWADYQAIESRFYQVVLGHHPQWGIPFSASSGGSAQQNETIAAYMAAGMPKLYELALSTTNSRRSRAGSEFKYIVCRLLETLEIPFVSEAQIGAQKERLDLGKNVDVLIPNPDQYLRDRTSCVLLSLKTSLRERWQQVAEEALPLCAGLLWRAAPWARRRNNQRHLGSVARRGWHVQAGQQLFFGEPPIRQHEIAVSLLRSCHLFVLPVTSAMGRLLGHDATQDATAWRWSASDPSASPYQRWHRSGPRVGDPLVAAPSSS